jgi:hypothetical protein
VNTDIRNALAGLGPFFSVDAHANHAIPQPPWAPIPTLTAPGERTLAGRVGRVRSALAAGGQREAAEIELRVAASVTHLGLVARLIAPALASTAFGFGIPWTDSRQVWWQDQLGGPFPLSVPEDARTDPVADFLECTGVASITEEVGRRYRLSSHVVWGNVASALNSAARLFGASRPDLAEAVGAAADSVLADARVTGGALRSGGDFQRHSCCLIYRIAGDRSAICGDCVLRR